MPVVATPVAVPAASGVISITEVRDFLRDYAGMNPLWDDVEFSDIELATAIDRAVDIANVVDRTTSWTAISFPNKYVLLLGAAHYLMQSESFRQMRNQASYQDGNIQPIGVDDKQAMYAQMAGMLKQEFRQHVSQMKISENMNASGFIRSPLFRGTIVGGGNV